MLSKAEKNLPDTLEDIRDNILLAQKFVVGQDFKAFLDNKEKIYAVIRCLEIISEASRRLPPRVREFHSQIAWKAIAAAGNVYRHEYKYVHDQEIWRTAHEDLLPLLKVVEEELRRIETP